ncbi:hypothetical protein FHG87_022949 [Trinorchestia longiramus]|nr:hypothetical protein FHG87_022949 [Trinorchestia longiramus]
MVFTDEKKFDLQQVGNHQNDRILSSSNSVEGKIVTRRQNAQSVQVWAAVTDTARSSHFFVPCGVKLNSKQVPFSYFQIKVATIITYRTFSGFTLESPTGFSPITWLQSNPNLNLEEHSILHKQRCIATKEPRPQSPGLFYLIHFGDKGFSYPSHFSRVPQSKTAKGMRSNSTRTDTCGLRCICKWTKL